jgi:hypothetical protein
MDALLSKFPHLDHFLNAYMHQDWRLSGDSLEAVLRTYAHDTSPSDVKQLRSEIEQFISAEGGNLEADYRKLYPNSVIPSGWHMTLRDWLLYVSRVAERAARH